MNMLALMATRPPIRVSPTASGDRDLRLERAVALVVDAKYSVRKAAHALSLPKSTVHRYLQATRTAPAAPTHHHHHHHHPTHHRVAKRPRPLRRRRQPAPANARPHKCELKFLLQGAAAANPPDAHPVLPALADDVQPTQNRSWIPRHFPNSQHHAFLNHQPSFPQSDDPVLVAAAAAGPHSHRAPLRKRDSSNLPRIWT